MILGTRGTFIESKFVFTFDSELYDPTTRTTPVDIFFSIIRGERGSGPIVDGPFSYFRELGANSNNVQITRTGTGQFTFRYLIPYTLREGVYSIYAQTNDDFGETAITSPFQVKADTNVLSPIVISNASSAVTNYQPTYEDLNRDNTGTICLIGHADNLELNNPVKVRSVQSAIDLLGADLRSPLLRGVFDAYAAGARDIFIMAAAPLGEYTEPYQERNTSSTLYNLDDATPSSQTFYEKYYERLNDTYQVLRELDYIDFIVPLEASIIKTGSVDFVTQLALHLANFHNETGFVQMGIIGSRSGGITSSDIQDIKNNSVLTNKLTIFRSDGTISADIGRFVIPVYGEAVYQHTQLKSSYTSPLAATYAGMMASMPLNMGLIRTRLPGVMSVFGNDLTSSEIQELESLGINTIYRGRRTRRSTPFEVYATNEYTLANLNSTLSKATQMKIVANVISRVKYIANEAIGRFAYDKAVDQVRDLLTQMKDNDILIDFAFKVDLDPVERGHLIFNIELLSALGLRKVDFAISAGPEA